MTQALLLVDIQNDYFPGGDMELVGMPEAAARAARLLERFREAGAPLVHVRHEFLDPGPGFFLAGSEGARIHSSVAPADGERIVTKNAVNAFHGTDLEQQLRDDGVTDLVVVGAMSHMCIEGSTRAAADLGFRCQVIHDACATRDLEFGGRPIPAAEVHGTSMAALGFAYADVLAADDWSPSGS